MKYLKLFISAIALFSFITGFSQNSLTGKVSDSAGKNTLPGAVIYIPDLKVAAQTNADGTYILSNLPKGTYIIEVQMLGYKEQSQPIKIQGSVTQNFSLQQSTVHEDEVVITGNTRATDLKNTPYSITDVSKQNLNENASTNVIDAIALTPGVSAITDGQSISKPVIRGLGYNRVLTINDGVEQIDQPWFDEFGIEADPDAVDRYEILKGPASLAYGSDAISGVLNLIPEAPLPNGVTQGEVLSNYQTNNGLINTMARLAGTSMNGISWSGRIDNTMAHAYQDPYDGYALNSQFSDLNTDGTIGIHKSWGYSQLHASYFDMYTGIMDGTRDSATGLMERNVAYPDLNGGAGTTFELPTTEEQKSYTPFVIYQRIQHYKLVWDNSVALGSGHINAIFSFQKNQRQETNDPTMPNTPDIYYYSTGETFDVRYSSPQIGGFNFAVGSNGVAQTSQSLGTLMLIPNYNYFQVGGFAVASQKIGNLNLSGGLRYDTRTFNGLDHWIDTSASSPQVPVPAGTPDAFEEFHAFTTTFSGMSWSLGATYDFTKNIYMKANVASGWRAPNVAEAGANGVHDGTVVYELGDPTLKPETNIEEDVAVGINSKDVSFEVDGFVNSINDFIYAQGLVSKLGGDSINNSLNAAGLGAAPVYKYTQGPAQLYGGEASLDIHPATLSWIELLGTLSYTTGGLQGVADSIKYLPFVPPMRITADIKFHIKSIFSKGVKNMYIKFGLLNESEQSQVYQQYAIYNGISTSDPVYQVSKAAQAGYTLYNAGIGGDIYSKGHKFCELYIICNNLMNTGYMDYMNRFKYAPVNPLTGRVGVFNMGRNVSVKLIIPIDLRSGN